MTANILDGKILAENLKNSLKDEIAQLKSRSGKVPHIVSIVVGEDPAAVAYANSQKKTADQLGIEYRLVTLPVTIPAAKLYAHIEGLNKDADVNGIMLQKPFPAALDYQAAVNHIDLSKDVEGVTVPNMGKLVLGESKMIPCTAAAMMEHILSAKMDLRGKEAVVIGRSEIVGKPLGLLLLQANATVTFCHTGTAAAGKLEEHIARADILAVAVGKPYFVKGEWVKKGAFVIDAGINKLNDKMVGDVEFEKAKERAGYITPVPGGVGPVTVVMLMRNALNAFKLQLNTK